MLMILLVVLAGFGVLGLLWAVFGVLLPFPHKMVLLQICEDLSDAEMAIHRHRWLTGAGVLRCPLVLIDAGLSPQERQTLRCREVASYDPSGWEELLRQEMSTDGGAGDPQRHGGGRGVPES